MDTPRSQGSATGPRSSTGGEPIEGKDAHVSPRGIEDLAGLIEALLTVKLDELCTRMQRIVIESNNEVALLRTQLDESRRQLEKAQQEMVSSNETMSALRAEIAQHKQGEERLQQEVDRLRADNDNLRERWREAEERARRTFSDDEEETSDTEKLYEVRYELMRQIDALNATMREKDNLLQEAGKEQLMLGQEVEKVRKERYENQVIYERRIKELQESLKIESREKEKERQERHLLEEQLAKARKKWPW